MAYKVFLVEDEVSTREGIRDHVDWHAMGFELSGEAPDGEIALPLIEAMQPDVLITDIKMPFMDGLQLAKIIREHFEWMKIIIISGYNDFQYAQTAIKLGVTEYLLKPVSLQDLQNVLVKVAVTLDQERSERSYLKRLRSQVEDNLSLLREKFLLRMVTGGESSISAVEQSHQLGLNILAKYYQVILIEINPADPSVTLDFQVSQQVEKLIGGLINTNNDVLLTKKDFEEFMLILKGETLEQIQQEGVFLAQLVQEEVEKNTRAKLVFGMGSPQQRLGDLHRSFAEALVKVKSARLETKSGDLRKLDHGTLLNFLENGRMDDYDAFYFSTVHPYLEASLRSSLLKHYVLLDIGLTIAQYVSDLGGNSNQVVPSKYFEDSPWNDSTTLADLQTSCHNWFEAAIAFRDNQATSNRASSIQQAKKYIVAHFTDPNLSLNEVASQVNFSPNHFSAVFSAETGETFRDYLTRTRLEQAKKLLRSTRLKCADVGFQCGYNDPHYFSLIFRKIVGMPPQQFREVWRKESERNPQGE